ncbi:spermidine/putrescine ABC transporter ATP-binding protein PotA [Pelagibaculum spongiae]|uniref:Spermidine/putrescine import ATP-binding protein PotA n=1 Tax=Pelagibaculum spongiae TaxID=2080658 RepID=A0A2V1GW59_9GAMM|nr:spermidine/putrescine ABC transporter ATP-binding protein PotA [Pelagibaculum spongiae]PVZ62948.1 spermidine/putrescine ABC transporter ATP-binding protein PotA [Pelagibaculum spongiae]
MEKQVSPIIKLSNVSKHFDGKQVVHPIDLTINDGEFITLLGPSGCGKTTILRMIAGLEAPDQGEIWLKDRKITQLDASQRPINTVFQSYALFPHMSVFENIAFGLRMQKVAESEIRQRVKEALEMVRLPDLANRKPHQLSGGQQQRIAIARAVVNRPRLLLLDEPLSALDYKLRKQMQNELKRIQRELGITFLFVTHDQEEALSMSDRVLVMRNGTVEQSGTPREVYETPRNMFVARFVGEINVFNGKLIRRLSENRIKADVDGWIRSLNCDNQQLQPGDSIKVLLRPEDLRISDWQDNQPGLAGTIVERNYKGMTLDSVIKLDSGETLLSSEFFNEDDPDFDHGLGDRVLVNWVESWEVVLPDEY